MFAVRNQIMLLVLDNKNKLRGRAREWVSYKNSTSWDEIKILLENDFGDSRDRSFLIQYFPRMRQVPNESVLCDLSSQTSNP